MNKFVNVSEFVNVSGFVNELVIKIACSSSKRVRA